MQAMASRNVRLLIAYEGSQFFGWQRQDGFESVQEVVEDALESLTGDKVVVHGAGRTDTGVHALGQVAHAHVDTRLDDHRLSHALNAHLPEGVTIRQAETATPEFHARFDAVGKRYMYVVATTPFRPPFAGNLCHWTREPMSLERIRRALPHFTGEQDFSALASAGSQRETNVRRLREIRLVARRDRFALVVQGNGFLYNMVRAISGTLLDVGRGRIEPDAVRDILDSRDRGRAGPTAPAAGLWLLRVRYAQPVFSGRVRGPRGAAGLFDY